MVPVILALLLIPLGATILALLFIGEKNQNYTMVQKGILLLGVSIVYIIIVCIITLAIALMVGG